MIRFAVVHRAKDGLALSASTDLDSGVELRDSKRFAKIISRKARQFPVRSTMCVGRFKIYFTTESEVCFLSICEVNYATVLAFSFLDDLKRDFLSKYTRGAVDKALRPYSFIEFDSVIQKTKQKYNNTRTLYTKIDLSDVSEELKNNPPYEVDERELGTVRYASNGTSHANSTGTTKNIFTSIAPTTNSFKHAPKIKMSPLSSMNMVAVMLSMLCAVLNIIRLVPFISQHSEDMENETHWVTISFCFLASGIINTFQCYILVYPINRRTPLNIGCALIILFILYHLYNLRNVAQIIFHVLSSIFMSYNIWSRPVQGKLPGYEV